jgi:hypothetical protein
MKRAIAYVIVATVYGSIILALLVTLSVDLKVAAIAATAFCAFVWAITELNK